MSNLMNYLLNFIQNKKKHGYMRYAAALSLWLVIVGMLLAGCGMGAFSDYDDAIDSSIGDARTGTNSTGDLIVVGISQLGSESVWRTANTLSLQSTFSRENGYFMIFNNARQKQENQIKAIRSFISQRVDYIIFSPVIEDGWETVLKEANDAGIPVILMDRAISKRDEALYTTHIGSDSKDEGLKAGRWLERELENRGRAKDEIKIIVIQGTRGSSAQRGRTMGFDMISDKHENWNILTQIDGEFTLSKGKEVMEQALKVYPEFDVLICQNDDMAMGALEVLKEHGISTGINGDVILISFDATHEALELVQQGIINVDVECNPDQAGMISDIIRRLEAGKEVEKEYKVKERVFTIDNVNDYIDNRTY